MNETFKTPDSQASVPSLRKFFENTTKTEEAKDMSYEIPSMPSLEKFEIAGQDFSSAVDLIKEYAKQNNLKIEDTNDADKGRFFLKNASGKYSTITITAVMRNLIIEFKQVTA